MYRILTVYAASALLTFAFNGKSLAGAFDRFDQGIDLLFDPGTLVFDAAFNFFVPSRKYDTVNGSPETVWLDQSVFWPSLNVKFVPFPDTACLTTYREPFGAETDYGSTWSQARNIVSRALKIEELGLTCSYRVRAGGGYVRFIGGITQDFATSHEEALRELPNGSTIRPAIDLEGSTTGWRAGLAYEVPNRAIRVSIMYYSQMDLSAHGTFSQLPLGGNAFASAVPVHGTASIPQTVEAVFQFPIAPAWLNIVSVKWADWSVWTRVPVVLSNSFGPLPVGRELTVYNAFFLDGWTFSNTISHRWSDNLTLALSLAWDRGVATGWTEHTTIWSARFGAIYSVNANFDLIGAVGMAVLAAGAMDKQSQGASYNATFDAAPAITGRLGFRVRI